MSKSLEDILNGDTEDQTVTASPDETVSSSAAQTQAEEDDTSVGVTPEGADVTSTASAAIHQEIEDQDDAATEGDTEGDTETEIVEQPQVPEADVTFIAKLLHFTKPVTLYGNRDATKVIGSYKGTVRQVDLAIRGVAPIEYTVISAGNKIVKRAFIHI